MPTLSEYLWVDESRLVSNIIAPFEHLVLEDLTEYCVDSRMVYQGEMLSVLCDEVRLPNDGTAKREYVKHPGAAAIIPLGLRNEVILERQYRYSTQSHHIEIPAGKRDSGESFLEAAQRELKEETGLTAASWSSLGALDLCIGYSNEKIHYFIAQELEWGETHTDSEENIQLFSLPLREAYQWVLEGRINDAKTVAGLLLYQLWANK